MISTVEDKSATGRRAARIKKSASHVPTPVTREDMENLMAQIAALKRSEAKIVLDLDTAIAALKRNVEEPLASIAEQLKPLINAAEGWATSNPSEFGKAKSIRFLHGAVGFRTGTPKVELLNRKWTWAKVLAAIQARAFQFVRSTPEVDKEAILRFYAEDKDQATCREKVLEPIGVKVTQDESFFVEPDLTPVTKRETAEGN